MAHPYHHSLSSVKKWGGAVSDYQAIHNWFDASKMIVADFRHRALRHHAEGIFLAETIFGTTIALSTGRVIPTRWIGEHRVPGLRRIHVSSVDPLPDPRRDGKIEVRAKGTIQLLDEWLAKRFKTPDREPINEAIRAFKLVWQLRQKPAHAIDENVFDQKYYHEQREIMKQVYGAVETLRLAFANHPKASSYRIPSALAEGKIWIQ